MAAGGEPAAVISGGRGVAPGTAYDLAVSAANVGRVFSWTIDWGDGQVQTLDGQATSAQHTYAQAGRYFISAAALTEEGELQAQSLRLGRPVAVAQIDGFGDAVLQMRTVGDLLYFTTGAPAGPQWLWRTDGTPAGTVRLAQLRPASFTGPQVELVEWEGKLFFCGYDADHGYELWSSDGTPGGTALVADISDGTASSSPTWLTVLGGRLFFSAREPDTGRELWASDGTAEGTLLVKDMYLGAQGGGQFTPMAPINPLPTPGSSNPSEFAVMSGVLYFAATDELGTHLWRSDGTGEGTFIVREFAGDACVGGPTDLLAVEGTLYFAVNSVDAGHELWRSDGTEEGTVLVAAFGNSPFADGLSQFTAYGESLYFVAYDSGAGQELWRSDGSEGGTQRVSDIAPGPASSSPEGLFVHDGALYFAADDGVHGRELWRSDGSEGGTQMVADLWVGAGGSAPSHLVSLGSRLAFVAGDALRGRELWTTDGTTDGTIVTPEALGGLADSAGSPLAARGGKAYFASGQGGVLTLWRSAGDALEVAVDGSPPVAEALVRRIKDPQNVRHPIHVIFTDDMEMSAETLAGGEILVSGPRGLTATPRLVGLAASPDGRTWTARYILRAPAETWGSQDNGVYTVTLSAGTAADLAGNFVAGGVLGRFSARLAIPRSYGDGTFSAADHDIAYDDAGNLHVVYRDPADGMLKYAVRVATGQWSVSAVVDAVSGNTGLRPSLAIDNLRRPAVAYYDAGARAVKFAAQNGFDWTIQTVAGRLRGVRHVAMAFDIEGRPAIAFDGRDQGLLFAQRRNGRWVVTQVDPDARGGARPKLAAVAGGGWAVAYSVPDAGELRYAVQQRRSWSIRVLDSGLGEGGAVSLAMDSQGRPAISYHDAVRSDLKFAAFDGSGWRVATVAAPGSQGIVSSLLFVADQPAIVYLDAGSASLRLAEQVEGQWRSRLLRSGAGAWLSASAGPAGASFGWLQSASGRVLVENL